MPRFIGSNGTSGSEARHRESDVKVTANVLHQRHARSSYCSKTKTWTLSEPSTKESITMTRTKQTDRCDKPQATNRSRQNAAKHLTSKEREHDHSSRVFRFWLGPSRTALGDEPNKHEYLLMAVKSVYRFNTNCLLVKIPQSLKGQSKCWR